MQQQQQQQRGHAGGLAGLVLQQDPVDTNFTLAKPCDVALQVCWLAQDSLFQLCCDLVVCCWLLTAGLHMVERSCPLTTPYIAPQ
jgi:hypothetical protein